jgi:ABC-type phosphate/phosphonate transport system substrate-binding protein
MKGRRLALGSQNSAQAAMLPLHFLQHSDPAEPVVRASLMEVSPSRPSGECSEHFVE